MKPILFNTTMVRAILDGRKTVTRRVIKDDMLTKIDQWGYSAFTPKGSISCRGWREDGKYRERFFKLPYSVGDILYVRETWNALRIGNAKSGIKTFYWYKADTDDENPDDKWRPSIHMPKEAARLFLRVTNIRVEKLQDMTIDDANKEGISLSFLRAVTEGNGSTTEDYSLETFETIWDSTIKKRDIAKYGWFANPYVWVIEFERCMMQEGKNDYERTD